MTPSYSLKQVVIARESWHFWNGLLPAKMLTAAWVANEDGETSFNARPGDHGHAGGAFQWWGPRRQIILDNTGIDVWTAPHLKQLESAHWEASESREYGHVWFLLLAQKTLEGAVGVLVNDFEKSNDRASDIEKRTIMGQYWLRRFG